MANPLMSVMLNNILEKEGRKAPATAVKSSGCSVNLREDQESMLLSSVLRPKSEASYRSENRVSTGGTRMITLEQLRGSNSPAPREEAVKSAVIEKTMVTLASIGKLSKK